MIACMLLAYNAIAAIATARVGGTCQWLLGERVAAVALGKSSDDSIQLQRPFGTTTAPR